MSGDLSLRWRRGWSEELIPEIPFYHADISPACDEPAPAVRRLCIVRQLAESRLILFWWASGEGGGDGGPYKVLIEPDLLRFTKWRPHLGLVGSEGRDTCQGTGTYPPVPKPSTRTGIVKSPTREFKFSRLVLIEVL